MWASHCLWPCVQVQLVVNVAGFGHFAGEMLILWLFSYRCNKIVCHCGWCFYKHVHFLGRQCNLEISEELLFWNVLCYDRAYTWSIWVAQWVNFSFFWEVHSLVLRCLVEDKWMCWIRSVLQCNCVQNLGRFLCSVWGVLCVMGNLGNLSFATAVLDLTLYDVIVRLWAWMRIQYVFVRVGNVESMSWCLSAEDTVKRSFSDQDNQSVSVWTIIIMRRSWPLMAEVVHTRLEKGEAIGVRGNPSAFLFIVVVPLLGRLTMCPRVELDTRAVLEGV